MTDVMISAVKLLAWIGGVALFLFLFFIASRAFNRMKEWMETFISQQRDLNQSMADFITHQKATNHSFQKFIEASQAEGQKLQNLLYHQQGWLKNQEKRCADHDAYRNRLNIKMIELEGRVDRMWLRVEGCPTSTFADRNTNTTADVKTETTDEPAD